MQISKREFDTVIIGAGAAGLMCALTAGQRGQQVLVVEKSGKIAEKIRISGGGRCNFTNLNAAPENYLSGNPKFCISALKGYGPRDFLALVQKHGIRFHEKKLGQLFCDNSAREIIDMLLEECSTAGVAISLNSTTRAEVERCEGEHRFILQVSGQPVRTKNLVIASGGKSIPKMGASGFAYEVAQHFEIAVAETRPGLVPFTLNQESFGGLKDLAGVSLDARVSCGKKSFSEAVLFTHRGLSGPAILQISSYWREGEEIRLDLAPGQDFLALLKEAKQDHPRSEAVSVLARQLPRRLAQRWVQLHDCQGPLANLGDKKLRQLAAAVHDCRIKPIGTEGYRTAEVTLGGVDTRALSSKTMEVKEVPGLYFIGEAVDVTGHLGGFNFQWAWSSAVACGRALQDFSADSKA